jgi:cytochrome c oxidase subunit 4
MAHSTTHAASQDSHHAGDHGHQDSEFAHPAPLSMLFAVFFALLALTGLTVYQSTLDLGDTEVWLSLFIATIKAALVILFFMHMLWDKPLNALLFISSLIFVALFLGFTLLDANAYRDQIELKDTLKESLPASLLEPAPAAPAK